VKFQSGPGFCGAASVVNALRALGIKARQDQVAQYAGTTAALGTSEHGIKQALERFGCSHQEVSERKYAAAEERLRQHLGNGIGPAILLAESGNHWVTAIGMLGQTRVIVFDSQLYTWNKAENGVHVVQFGEQLRRYWLPYAGKRYALLVTGP